MINAVAPTSFCASFFPAAVVRLSWGTLQCWPTDRKTGGDQASSAGPGRDGRTGRDGPRVPSKDNQATSAIRSSATAGRMSVLVSREYYVVPTQPRLNAVRRHFRLLQLNG